MATEAVDIIKAVAAVAVFAAAFWANCKWNPLYKALEYDEADMRHFIRTRATQERMANEQQRLSKFGRFDDPRH